MAETATQENRLLSIATPLGEDKLLLRSLTGYEGISQLFSFHVDLLSEDDNINFNQIIGQNVTLGVKLADNETERYFNGHISRFIQLPEEGRYACYQAEVVPWLWFLTRTSDCRIFQNKKVPEIIQEIFKLHGFSDFELQLRNDYEPWEYCVQYRESACNFVMRLMEQEGIFFFFKHEEGKHTMVLADAPLAHKPCPNQPRVRYEHSPGEGAIREEDVVESWRVEHELRPGKYTINDFYFETPSSNLLASVESQIEQNGNKKFEIYDYPGEYEKRDGGDDWVKLRMEEESAAYVVISGSSNCRDFTSGFRFDLSEHFRRDQNGTYVLTSVSHHAYQSGYEGAEGEGGSSYNNTFTCIQHSVVYRAPRITPKPLMQGCQTATVVGPAGEEIYTDKYGRVKVQFHWDREGKRDENSSCWIRVSQPWAGKGWGGISIPRIGQEVIIDFLEGDPDRPIITGRVYNAEAMPPYGLPAGKVVSGIKSNTHKGKGYNELSMDDTAGKEKITIHGQYDMNTTVEHDQTTTVHNCRTDQIDVNDTETVGGDQTATVMKNRTRTVNQNETVTVALTRTHSVGINEMINVGAAQEVTVGAIQAITVGASQTVNVGINQTESVGSNRSISVGKNDTLNVGNNIQIAAGKNIVIEAGDQILIKTGDASILMKKDGTIMIKGKNITVKASGKIVEKADGDIIMKGSKILEN
jgi:type VI secretion system secreted protein VgrG